MEPSDLLARDNRRLAKWDGLAVLSRDLSEIVNIMVNWAGEALQSDFGVQNRIVVKRSVYGAQVDILREKAEHKSFIRVCGPTLVLSN